MASILITDNTTTTVDAPDTDIYGPVPAISRKYPSIFALTFVPFSRRKVYIASYKRACVFVLHILLILRRFGVLLSGLVPILGGI